MRIVFFLVSMLAVSAAAFPASAGDKPAGGPIRLEIALDKSEYAFRGCIALTITYTNTSKETVVLLANGGPSGEGFPGETFEITSGAGRTTYTIVAVDPEGRKVTIEPGKSWKRTIKDLAVVLSNSGVTIDGKGPVSSDGDSLPDPFGRLDEYTMRLSFQSAVKAQPKPAFNSKVESNTAKFKVVLR